VTTRNVPPKAAAAVPLIPNAPFIASMVTPIDPDDPLVSEPPVNFKRQPSSMVKVPLLMVVVPL
jgi:hypothetical protein